MYSFIFCVTFFYYCLCVQSKLYLHSDVFLDSYTEFQENRVVSNNDSNKALFNQNFNISTGYKLDFWKVCSATFMKPHNNYVSILTINNEFLNPKEVQKVFDLVEWHTTVTTWVASNAVIVVIEAATELHQLLSTPSSLWDQNSRFVIVVLQCTEDVRVEMATLWRVFFIYKYTLVCGAIDPIFYIFRPFLPHYGSRIFRTKDVTEIQHNILHGTDNMYGAVMRIVFFPRIPNALTKNGQYISGPDYLTLLTMKEKMNFTAILFRPTDGQSFTQAGEEVTGSARDVVIGNADIAFNGHFVKNYKIPAMRMTREMFLDKICFIVGMPTFKSHFTVIIHIFSLGVWIQIVLMYYIIIILYYVIEKNIGLSNYKHDIQELCIQTFALIVLGASNLHTDLSSKKLLIGSALVTALILNNTFQGSLVPALSRPKRNDYIDTLEQIMQSNLALQSQRAESLISDPEITQLLNTLRKRKLNKEETNFIRVGSIPFTKLIAYKNYLNYRDNLTEYLHVVPECLVSNFVAYVVPRNSPFLDIVNTNLLRFQEVGLNSKWFSGEMDNLLRDFFRPLENEHLIETKAKIFSMGDLVFVFTLLLSGLLVSTIVFIIEHCLGFYG